MVLDLGFRFWFSNPSFVVKTAINNVIKVRVATAVAMGALRRGLALNWTYPHSHKQGGLTA